MSRARQHTYQVLTKRPDRLLAYYNYEAELGKREVDFVRWPLSNVWLGVTAENQKQADKRIPVLLQIPAAVRFVSVEPMLSSMDLRAIGAAETDGAYRVNALTGEETYPDSVRRGIYSKLNWVICGGESGQG